MVGDASQHVGEPGARVDVVELGRDDERVHGRSPVAATVAAGEQPRLPARAMPRSARSAALFVRQMRPSPRNRVKVSQRFSMYSIALATALWRDSLRRSS